MRFASQHLAVLGEKHVSNSEAKVTWDPISCMLDLQAMSIGSFAKVCGVDVGTSTDALPSNAAIAKMVRTWLSMAPSHNLGN